MPSAGAPAWGRAGSISPPLTLELNPIYLEEARQVIGREEPAVTLLMPNQDQEANLGEERLRRGVRIGISALLLLLGLLFRDALHATPYHLGEVLVFGAAYLVVGGKVLAAAAGNLLHGRPTSEQVLMAIATLGAFVVHEMPEAVAVMLFYTIGEGLESIAVARSRRSIADLVKLRPEGANWLQGDKVVRVRAESVPLEATLLVRPGERVPLDGLVREGTSLLDTSALTGESLPSPCKWEIRSWREWSMGRASCGLRPRVPLCRYLPGQDPYPGGGSSRPQGPQRAFHHPLRPHLHAVGGPGSRSLRHPAAPPDPRRSLLAVGLPGAHPSGHLLPLRAGPLRPTGLLRGLGGASRAGILVKGANFLEAMATPRVVAFDKTGTLTRGSFQLQRVKL